MKEILWRWKSQKETPFSRAVIQKEYDLVVTIGENPYTCYYKYIRKDEIEIIEIGEIE